MIFPAENLTSRKGISFKIRSAEPEDAPGMLAYMKTMLGETPFLLRTPEEFSYTPEEEAAILASRRDDPRGVMLLVEHDGRVVANAAIDSHGAKSRVLHRAELGSSRSSRRTSARCGSTSGTASLSTAPVRTG